MGNSPWAFGWHLLSMMHMSCTLLMISCCSPDPQKMSKWSHLRPWALSSIINRCFNMPGWFFWFSHLQMVDKIWQSLAICKLDTASCPQEPLNCGRWCHCDSCSVGFSCPLSDYQPKQPVLVTTWSCPTWVIHPEPFADIFWAWCTCHVPCWWSHVAHLTLKKRQSGLISVPGLCLQSSTAASTCLVDFSDSRICRWLTRYDKVWPFAN